MQKVLDYRVEVEEKKREEFVKAQKTLLSEEKKLNELNNARDTAVRDSKNYLSIMDYQILIRYIDSLETKIKNQIEIIEKAKELCEKKKQELIDSTSDRKVIEKLRERAKEEFDFEVNKREQSLNDDFALFAYTRRKGR